MANWFVDTNVGGGGNDGISTDDAWQSIETAIEWNGFTPGDKIWIKRDSSYLCAGDAQDIAPTDDGTAAAPIYFIGWPRAAIPNTDITEADFTNGSNIIDNVVGITPDREKHVGRYITAPDGFRYMITAVLWEAVLDGIEDGVSEFTVGSKLTNVTQTKYGKVWGYTDDGGTAGTIQYVRDSAVTFVEDDNLTDADSGDGEIDAGGETPVGFLIDREYAGPTVTTTNGKFQIEADEDYTEAQAIDDSGFTIKLSTWDDDADDLPSIDFGNFSSNFYLSADAFYEFKNLELRDSTDTNGLFYENTAYMLGIHGCLLHQDQNQPVLSINGTAAVITRSIIEGNLIGSNQRGVYLRTLNSKVKITDSAIYGLGDNGISILGLVDIDNVNVGVEIGNGDNDIVLTGSASLLVGKDLDLGENVGGLAIGSSWMNEYFAVENYKKTLEANIKINTQGSIIKVDVVPGSGDPYKRSGGADSVINIEYDSNLALLKEPQPEYSPIVFTHEFEATTDSKSYRYYVQCEGIVTAVQLYIVAEYVDSYDDDSEYTMITQQSNETFTARADAEDWAEYMEVTGIQPAVGSKVRIKCYCSYYHASNNIYIDPKVVIS